MTRIAIRQLERQAEFLGITIHSHRPGRTRLYQAELKDGHFSCSMPIREFSAYLDGFERAHRERPNDELLLAAANACQVLERISWHLPSDWQPDAETAQKGLSSALEPYTQEIEKAKAKLSA